jgi:MTH538 TIR-like domain (DUF1863)
VPSFLTATPQALRLRRGLQKWLQTYAKPWWRWRTVNVFRDETDLTAAPALWSRIADALDQSSHFILLASPEAAQSKWIKREIRYWLGDQHAGALDGPDLDAQMPNPNPERIATLLIALTAGDISWDDEAGSTGDFDWSKTNAVPRQLAGVFTEEPHWVNLRTVVQREHLRSSLSRSNAEFMPTASASSPRQLTTRRGFGMPRAVGRSANRSSVTKTRFGVRRSAPMASASSLRPLTRRRASGTARARALRVDGTWRRGSAWCRGR